MSSKKKLKPQVRLFLADELQEIVGGKINLMGFYADSVIVAQFNEGDPEPTAETPMAFEGLAILITITGIHGKHKVTVQMDPSVNTAASVTAARPNQRRIAGDAGTELEFEAGKSANITIRLRPFVTNSLGKKTVMVTVGDVPTELSFEVRRGVLPKA